MSEANNRNSAEHTNKNNSFICGVVEGFYGRPWTTEQRKDLFRKLKKWGMNSYVYAPKDDYKHRAFWRELYTVEEADHLSGLISAAKEQDIVFYYALSPGLDITYSSVKEITALKRKLEQVSQFGCEAFALLFDDIESEMSKSDKEVFQSFAHAQVTITNDVFNHLNSPTFLFCPTQYCSTRAVPNVTQSEYLNTIGAKLESTIDILWTGQKVITKLLTTESIQEITEVLKRRPVIWDNLHANDYDQKRVFLGPYSGRSVELIPLLGGVVTNPNCEFHANTIAIHTLAHWSKCNSDTKINNDSISADIKLEIENEDGLEDGPVYLAKNAYHPRRALKNAILDWFPEFFIHKEVTGPITKPHPQVTMVMPIIPIIPSLNTCMSLQTTTTSTTTTTSCLSVPEVNTTQLQAFADVCSSVSPAENIVSTISNAVMNSLVSSTKVITSSTIVNPIVANVSNLSIPDKIPVSSIPIPIMNIKQDAESNSFVIMKSVNAHKLTDEDNPSSFSCILEKCCDNHTKIEEEVVPLEENITEIDEILINANNSGNSSNGKDFLNGSEKMHEDNPSPNSTEPMECGSIASERITTKCSSDDVVMSESTESCSAGSMQVETSDTSLMSDMVEDTCEKDITIEDLTLLCDLFYLPFEHGSKGIQILNEFYWLKSNASILVSQKKNLDISSAKPEVQEWFRRSDKFSKLCQAVYVLTKKMALIPNKEICYDLYSYVWDISAVISLMNAFIKWLSLGHYPVNINSYTQGSYTWFSKGWKESFSSGDQEPWVFRGGLTADLQRLIPVDSGNDLFIYKSPDEPTTNLYSIRPYGHLDEEEVYSICHKTCRDGSDSSDLFPENLQGIPEDRLVGPFLTINPELCVIIEDSVSKIVGYACAAIDAKLFYKNQEMCWFPEMCLKYPIALTESDELSQAAKDSINHFHNFKYDCPQEVLAAHPSIMTCCILNEQNNIVDESVSKRLVTVLLAALRSNGSFGVHVCINQTDRFMHQFYSKMGFAEIYQDSITARVYLGRNF